MKNIDRLRKNLPRSTYGNLNLGTGEGSYDTALANTWKLLDALDQDTSPATLTIMLQALAIIDADNKAAYVQFIRMLASGRPY